MMQIILVFTEQVIQNLHYNPFKALKGRGLQVVRLPFKWERAQRSLGGPLDAGYMGLIVQMLKDTKTAGMLAILDMHNYARYKSNGVYGIIGQSNGPTTAHYADVWKKISAHIKAVPDAHNALYAYDIMNEPHDIPGAGGLSGAKIWEKYAQVAVDAIRSNGDKKMIHIEGRRLVITNPMDRFPSSSIH